jgi:hypothetical protein
MEKKIERIGKEIENLTKRLNSLKEKTAGVRFIDFMRSFGSDIILIEKKIEILTTIKHNLTANPTNEMFERQYDFVCRIAMNSVGFSSGAFSHTIDALCNNAVKEVYDFLTYIE